MGASKIGVGHVSISLRARLLVKKVLDSGRLSYGPMSRRLEAMFAKAHQSRFAIFCNSGTSALHIAVAALKEKYGWQDGEEVIVPAQTFVATANVLLHNRLQPVLVDVDKYSYNLDPKLLPAAITWRTRAILPVHLMGRPADMGRIMEMASVYKLRVIEDSCESVLATFGGKSVGSFGDIGCFSTYAAHHVVTGVGGLALTSDKNLAVMMRSLMNHGRDSIYISIDDDDGANGKRLREIMDRRFNFVRLGHSFRATELEAALGIAQMEVLAQSVRRRKKIARIISAGLKHLENRLQLPHLDTEDYSCMGYPIVMLKESKKSLTEHLEARGIETRDIPGLIHQPVYRHVIGGMSNGKRFPVANWINESGFYVGCHPGMTDADAEKIVHHIGQWARSK